MLCSEYVDTIVPKEYFENLKVDNISIDIDIVERAKKNNADAIHAIGCEYASINENEKAIDWLGISAAMAFPESQLELGHLFANFGDPLNQCRLEWYFRARENGVSSASFYIASTLFGLGLYFEAKKYDQEAADLGDAESQFYLGFYYYSLWDIPYFLSTFTTDKKISSGMVS